MPSRALVITDLKKQYKNGTEALKGVSLTVPAGDFFALLGPNGAGKTTIIGIITGLVTKTRGTVTVFGHDIDREPERAKDYIGLVGQEINFNPFEKPLDIVVNQGGYYGITRSVALPRAQKLLQDLGLGEKMTQTAMTLSGGMKRRLMIARALIHEPKFLILDEPTAGVDVELRRSMWDYLQKLTAGGLTILLTTHYLEEAEQLCRHVAIINKGSIVASGSMKDILGQIKSESIIIDLVKPVTDKSVHALQKYDAKKLDDTTIEIKIGEGRGLNAALIILQQHDLPVQTIRNKTGKLEEVFVGLIKE